MQAVLLNGGAKTSKTTMAEGIHEYARNELGFNVVCGDAGQHYRKLTVLTRELLRVTGLDVPPEDEVSDAVAQVLESGDAYDTQRQWTGLDSDGVNAWVSTAIANRPTVKADASQWYERTAQGALDNGADLLIINGRQPRQVLQPWLTKTGLLPAIEFWAECDAHEAARRVLRDTGKPLTDENVNAKAIHIAGRRLADMKHGEFPMTPPENPVTYLHRPAQVETMARIAVIQSWQDGTPELPRPIIFDNTDMQKAPMIGAASVLAATAMQLELVV